MMLHKYELRKHIDDEALIAKILRKSVQIGVGYDKTIQAPSGRIMPVTCFKRDSFMEAQKEFIKTVKPSWVKMNKGLLKIVGDIK